MRYLIFIPFIFLACIQASQQVETAEVVAADSTAESVETTITNNECSETSCVDGNAVLVAGKDGKYNLVVDGKTRFNIQITEPEYPEVVKIYLHSTKLQYVVSYELSNASGGISRVAAFDRETGASKWLTKIVGTNLSTPLKLEEVLYVATRSHASKLKMQDGTFVWFLQDLGPTAGAIIELRENIVEIGTVDAKLRIDDKSGKIL